MGQVGFMRRNRVGVNIIFGWMRAYKADDAGNEKSWSSSKKVDTLDEIGEALKEAVSATGSRGDHVAIVLDHDLLRHKTFTLPSMNPKDLELYLARQISQLKEFEEEAVFSYTKTASSKGEQIVSVNFLPRYYLEGLSMVCLDAGLYLNQLVPLTRVMARRFQDLQIADDELAALVDKLYNKVTMLIGKKDGSIFSDRHLLANIDTTEDMERMGKEINRSILFNKQKFSEKVALVRLSESFPEEFFASVKKYVNVRVEPSPKIRRFYWIKELLTIPARERGNLVSRKEQREQVIRKWTRTAASLILTLFLGAVSTTALVEYLLYKERKPLAAIKSQVLVLQNEKESWEKRRAEFNRLEYTIKTVEEDRIPPLPGWFIGYIGTVLPDGLVLTKSRVEYRDGGWEILIEGVSKKGHEKTAENLRQLSRDLETGPFKVSVNDSWYQDWLKELKSGIISDYRVSSFSLTGVIR